ncbi:MAG: alpha/beta hydrolase [Pseudomonadota bacterium]
MSIRRTAAVALLLLGVYSCGHKAQPPQVSKPVYRLFGSDSLRAEFKALFAEPYSETRRIPIYYVTNRNLLNETEACNDRAFGIRLGTQLSYGVCGISVPKKHAVGQIEKGPGGDPDRFFRAVSHTELDEANFLGTLQGLPPADFLLFVHGFNVRFEEAVFRAAQIAYDLKFQGNVILFSWPAGAESGLVSSALVSKIYDLNQTYARRSVEPFVTFLKAVDALNLKIHVLVHSMGHQVVIPALARLTPPEGHRLFGELILNAPDIGQDEFHDLLPKFKKVAERVTVYCSYNDRAISASQAYNEDLRLGACETMPGVDVINVGEIGGDALGHSYYASRPIVTDMFQTLLGIPAEDRLFIRRSGRNAPENYFLRP